MGDEAITLGPQGDLAKWMSVRGQPFFMQGIAGPNNGYGSSTRNFLGGSGGGSTTGPPSSAFYSGKSFKKAGGNAQGVNVPTPNQNVSLGSSNSSIGGLATQNGAHIQQPLRGLGKHVASSTGAAVKSTDVQRCTPGLPKAPQSNAAFINSGTTGPSTPVKGPADASRAFSLQFGPISPGVINGMQFQTNSHPPSLDEQKRAQIGGQLSSVGVQETSKPSMFSVRISKDVSEASNKVEGTSKSFADLSASKCDNDEESYNHTY